MCAIAGIIGNLGDTPDRAVLDRLSAALAHRGPDGQGIYVDGPCGLVHTRLAIMDVDGGDQPFISDKVALIANGEIYNNPELRSELKTVEFSSQSDCEPPLHLYLRHGLDYVAHLRGMYAIAIWDGGAERLVLSRDPFGIKPLYYAHTQRGFAFASEQSALIKAELVEPHLNPAKRDELLQLQFTTGRDGLLTGIHRVLPGETLVVEQGKIVERRVRKILPTGKRRHLSHEQALDDLDHVLNDCVKVHQRSDVPYGMFLSGGIDSSILLAMMKRLNVEPVMAFTAGFSGTSAPDEREQARALAASQGANHIEVEFGAKDFWQTLPHIASHMDEPVADYAALPTWKLAAAAKAEGFKVVLTGEGGDELFGGYGRYRTAKRWFLPKEMYRKGILEHVDVLRHPDASHAWRAGMAQAKVEASSPNRSPLQTAQAQDIATWLPGDLLTKVDRMLMAHGVEGRVPFLDPRMAEFAYNLPDKFKVKHRLGKRLLRDWLARTPLPVKPYAKKQGFTVPVGTWILGEGDKVGELVARQDCIQAICHKAAVQDLFRRDDVKSGKAAWTLLFYALWSKIHIQGTEPEGDVFDVLSA